MQTVNLPGLKATRFVLTTSLAVALLRTGSLAAESADPIKFITRSRIEKPKGSGQYQVVEKTVEWAPAKTAIIICDMWDQHWCKGASARVAEMAPVMNRVVSEARTRGVLVVHAPSETMDFYKDTPQRKRAQSA